MNPCAPVTRALDIVVPIRNEVDSIDEFHARVERLGLADALIFVDNASTDGTLERLAVCPRVRVIRHATDEGWGASMRDGIAASDGELIVIIDADLEYPPEAIRGCWRRYGSTPWCTARVSAERDHPTCRSSAAWATRGCRDSTTCSSTSTSPISPPA